MTTKKAKVKKPDPSQEAEKQADRDILNDPELSESDPSDDLDEGELARRDNSDEAAFDQLEKKRPATGSRTGKDAHQ